MLSVFAPAPFSLGSHCGARGVPFAFRWRCFPRQWSPLAGAVCVALSVQGRSSVFPPRALQPVLQPLSPAVGPTVSGVCGGAPTARGSAAGPACAVLCSPAVQSVPHGPQSGCQFPVRWVWKSASTHLCQPQSGP